MKIPEFKLTEAISLWKILPRPVHSEQILSMEDLDQAYGYILYRKQLEGPVGGDLVLDEVHDYAQIYLDGRSIGSLDRRLSQNHLVVKIPAAGARLDILVENSGRINFSLALRGERKGITKQVTLAGKPVLGWDIYSLPMTDLPVNSPLKSTSCVGPCFFLGAIFVDKQADTFFDTSAFTKGALWFGRPEPLGRIWNIGPQQTLYAPGPFFLSSRGFQGVVVFEMNAHELPYTLTGLDQPILDRPVGH